MAATATIKFPSKWAEVAAQSHGGVGLPNLAEASDVRREVETVGNPPQPNNPPQAPPNSQEHIPQLLPPSQGSQEIWWNTILMLPPLGLPGQNR